MMGRGLIRACPVCGQRGLFRLFEMKEDCPRCGLHFERIEGHWIGAIGINTVVTFGLVLIGLIVSLILAAPEFDSYWPMVVLVLIAVGVPTLFFGGSRMVWTAMDISMRPLEPDEIDWTVLDPSLSQPDTTESS